MKPEQFYKRFGNEFPADEFKNTSTASGPQSYGGAWIVYYEGEDGYKHLVTQSMNPVLGVQWIARLRELQRAGRTVGVGG